MAPSSPSLPGQVTADWSSRSPAGQRIANVSLGSDGTLVFAGRPVRLADVAQLCGAGTPADLILRISGDDLIRWWRASGSFGAVDGGLRLIRASSAQAEH